MAIGTALAIGAGLSAAGSVANGVIGANAASSAADQHAAAAREANALQGRMWDEQKQMYTAARDQSRADLDPWRQNGVTASNKMNDADFQRDFGASDFTQDAGYQFRMAEGQKALERSAAARGGLQSGGTMKALAAYGQGVASEEYGNAYNRFNADRDRRFSRLSSISGAGQNAASGMGAASMGAAGQMGQAGANYAGNVGANLMGSANAQGAAKMAGANAIGGAISGIGGAANGAIAGQQQQNWMNRWMDSQEKKGG